MIYIGRYNIKLHQEKKNAAVRERGVRSVPSGTDPLEERERNQKHTGKRKRR